MVEVTDDAVFGFICRARSISFRYSVVPVLPS